MALKFLVDAQLPMHLKHWLLYKGYDAIHTRELPDHNLTEDNVVMQVADEEDRIVISKDSDFHKSYLIRQKPQRLFMLTTGNIVNAHPQRSLELTHRIAGVQGHSILAAN